MYKSLTQKKTPNAYEWTRTLFIKNRINMNTAKRLIFDLTFTHKNSNKYKNTLIELNQLIKEYEDRYETKQDEHIINIDRSNYQIDSPIGYIDRYGYWLHKDEVRKMMKKNPNTIIIHKAEFYIDGIKQEDKIKLRYYESFEGEVTGSRNLKERPIKFDFIDTSLTREQLGAKIDWYVTIGGSGGSWVIEAFYKYCEK
jgi:hypothetical protein